MHETVRGNATDAVLLVGQAEVDKSHVTLDTSRQQRLRHSTARSRILDRGHLAEANVRSRQMGIVHMGCTSSRRETSLHVTNSLSQHFYPSDFGAPARQSGAFSVQCEQAARAYAVMTSRCRYLIICVPWHCSVISQPVQRLGAPLAWSATPLSFTWWQWWPTLGDGVVVCQFILCARHFVLALWLCFQICLAGASTELGTLLLG